tara:strand:+ start:142 stop:366 length:225 start_codon:yes stop_codon:yes gene_type:complete
MDKCNGYDCCKLHRSLRALQLTANIESALDNIKFQINKIDPRDRGKFNFLTESRLKILELNTQLRNEFEKESNG